MFLPRSVHAHLIERFIFNFRVRPDVLASHLPVSYLRPQVFYDWSVVSFCLLKLEHVMISPLPSWSGLKTISCAYRCGVVDISGLVPVPSVYILGRYTDHAMVSHLGPWIFSSALPYMYASLSDNSDVRILRVFDSDHRCLFSALVQPSTSTQDLSSHVFDSLESFAHFIKLGVSSYAPSIYKDALARVDLQKQDTRYEVLKATVVYSSLDALWANAELIFDSAIRATGGLYKWTYRNIVKGDSSACQA